eukprot:CAMPEP_0117581344 /NCGR_PEP_ID=MMETSP0784-20121206/65768_1 /TAXON_ID=39447 /ORGANISM="" /LENGTH=63 /DNA_ID=CAMNT_0005381631 /DNA_START=78 /DNA_END=265 /DNA_ORIENTATION=+
MILSFLAYVVSFVLKEPIWSNEPVSFNWNMVVLKWTIVNGLAAVPLLCILSFKLSDFAQQALA